MQFRLSRNIYSQKASLDKTLSKPENSPDGIVFGLFTFHLI